MTTQYTPTLKLALPVTGELSGTWGDTVNDNITSMIEQAIAGLSTINTWTGNAHTLTTANGTTSESRCAMLVAATGGGAPTAAAEIICPSAAKLYVLQNNTAFAVTLKTSAGTGVSVPASQTAFLFCDGTNVNACVTTIVDGNVSGNLTVQGNATINGNTTLGNATSDTITATARFNTDLVPSTDNARDLGSAANSWKDLFIDGTATMALVAISGGTINGVSIGATTAATLINVDNLRLDGNTLSSTDTNGNVVIAPNGTGDVQLDADTVRVGDSAAAATLTSNGAGALTVTTGGAADLTLSTNAGANSGTVVIANGVNGNITLTPDGTGDVILSADRTQIGDLNTDALLTTSGTGNLNLSTNNGTNSGTIQITQGVNGSITLTPNGTGVVSVPTLGVTGGTANGVAYLNGSKVLTTGSALTFDGSTFGVTAAGSTAALRITQTGTGDALLVEDSANPDSTPFVIDAVGRVVIGSTSGVTTTNGVPFLQINGDTGQTSGESLIRWRNDTIGTALELGKSRGGAVGTHAVLTANDDMGDVRFIGSDGTSFIEAASISAFVDGTPGTNDMPGRLVFSTTADGASSPTERMRISSTGQTTISGNTIVSVTDNTNAALRITQLGTGNALLVEDSANPDASPFVVDQFGRVVVGHTANTVPAGTNPFLQIQSTGSTQSAILGWSTASAASPNQAFYRSASGIIGTQGVVVNGADLGALNFYGDDGTAFIQAAQILTEVDGTPGTNDMPGRLVFSTTADGASAPTERFRIGSAGQLGVAGANYGTSGQALVSQGSGAPPTWGTAGISSGKSIALAMIFGF